MSAYLLQYRSRFIAVSLHCFHYNEWMGATFSFKLNSFKLTKNTKHLNYYIGLEKCHTHT